MFKGSFCWQGLCVFHITCSELWRLNYPGRPLQRKTEKSLLDPWLIPHLGRPSGTVWPVKALTVSVSLMTRVWSQVACVRQRRWEKCGMFQARQSGVYSKQKEEEKETPPQNKLEGESQLQKVVSYFHRHCGRHGPIFPLGTWVLYRTGVQDSNTNTVNLPHQGKEPQYIERF